MKTIYTTIFLILSITTFAQPKIEFEISEFDFGVFVSAGTIKKRFTFKNIGNEPLIITRTATGDGGSYAMFPREPIMPDSTGEITFVYNSKRIGRFQKCISVQYNSQTTDYRCKIRVKGEVIFPITQVELNNDTIDMGEIPFGTIDNATFEVKNIGEENLYLDVLTNKYYEPDLFYTNIRPKISNNEKANKSGVPYEPNEVAKVTIALRNVYGNAGDFQRIILLKYNSLDTISVVIKGKYIGEPTRSTIYEDKAIFKYDNGQLQTKTNINYSGDAQQVSYFKGPYCTHSQYYSWQTGKMNLERFFEFGELIEEKKHDNGY